VKNVREWSPILPGFGTLAGRYDAALLDLWGVIHDGHRLYPGVADCVAKMRAHAMRILLLSNAPRRSDAIIPQLARLGLAADAYDGVVTSGDAARAAITNGADDWHAQLGRRCFRLGPERDWGLLAGLEDWTIVADLAEADFILTTGLFDDRTETVTTYDGLFAEAVGRGLPMICANPDLVVIRAGERVLCAGSLAAAYEQAGGEVVYHGKPHPSVYRMCFERLEGAPRERIVAIGDSLRTDIAGARGVGIDAVFVTGGIHAEELGLGAGEALDIARLEAVLEEAPARPTAVLPALVW
jgi:HAD superfamily hydrolase (TIGR01459 family)